MEKKKDEVDLTIFLPDPITYDYKGLLAFRLTYILAIVSGIYPERFQSGRPIFHVLQIVLIPHIRP